MTEAQVGWTARVEETFQALRDADRDAQELACKAMSEEGAAKLRGLFEADRAKLLERAAEITKDIEKAETSLKNPDKVTERKAEVEKAVKEATAEIIKGQSFEIKVFSTEHELKLIAELAGIFGSDKSEKRLRYNTQKAEVAQVLGVTQMDVHRSVVKWIEEMKKEKTELTQSQKVVGLMSDTRKVQLWVDPSDRKPYVSVMVGKHCENYRLGDQAFEDWLRGHYGELHWTEVEAGGYMRRISGGAQCYWLK